MQKILPELSDPSVLIGDINENPEEPHILEERDMNDAIIRTGAVHLPTGTENTYLVRSKTTPFPIIRSSNIDHVFVNSTDPIHQRITVSVDDISLSISDHKMLIVEIPVSGNDDTFLLPKSSRYRTHLFIPLFKQINGKKADIHENNRVRFKIQ